MYSTLVSPKQQPHLSSPWSQLRRSKYIESKGEGFSECVKARFLMSLRLLGMTTLRCSTKDLSFSRATKERVGNLWSLLKNMYSTLVSPKQQPHLASPWSQLQRSKYIEGKGEELSERVKASFLMSPRLLGITRKIGSDEHPTPEKTLPLRDETSMPSKPCQYKGELEGVVNTERQT